MGISVVPADLHITPVHIETIPMGMKIIPTCIEIEPAGSIHIIFTCIEIIPVNIQIVLAHTNSHCRLEIACK